MASRARKPSHASSSSRRGRLDTPGAATPGCCLSYVADVHIVEHAAQFPAEAGAKCFDTRDVLVGEPVDATCVCHLTNHCECERKALEDEAEAKRVAMPVASRTGEGI